MLFRKVFEMEQDNNFISHEIALPEHVRGSKVTGSGPDPDDLHFDMREGPDSLWNSKVIDILLNQLHQAREQDEWNLLERSDWYLQALIQQKYQ